MQLLAVQTNEADGIKELPEIEHRAELIRDKRSLNNPSQCNLPLLALAPTCTNTYHTIFGPTALILKSVSNRMRDETVRYGFVMPNYGHGRASRFERVVRDEEGNIVGVRVFRDNKTGKFLSRRFAPEECGMPS